MPTTPTAVFRYAGYRLDNARTVEYRHEAVMDPSGTDYLYTRHSLRIQGILTDTISSLIEQNPTESSAAEVLKMIEHDMLRPRQPLEYSQNDKMILEVEEGGVDAENGPKPQSFNVILMTQAAIIVEFSVVVCLIGCDTSTARQRGWTSNRWTESEDYDQAGYCTLTTRGTLIVASDLRKSPDHFRDIVTPVIRNGYQRMSSNYTLSEDGLRLTYTFTDKEFYLGPPYPAMKASGSFTVIAVPGQYTLQVTVRLEGDKNATKRELIERAALIVNSKAALVVQQDNDPSRKHQSLITQLVMREELYDNIVEVSCRGAVDSRKLSSSISGARLDIFGTAVPGSPTLHQPGVAPTLRGNNQFLMLLAAAFNDPCVDEAILMSNGHISEELGETELRGSWDEPSTFIGRIAQAANQTPPGGIGRPPVPGEATARVMPATRNLNAMQGTNPASIVVAPAPVVVPNAEPEFPYDLYTIRLSYLHRTGDVALPGTHRREARTNTTTYNVEGYAKASKTRVHNPTLRIIAEWSAERVGEPPDLPDPCSDDCNYVLIESGITTDELQPISGTYMHRVTGRYVYDCLDTTAVPLASALPPFLIGEIKNTVDPQTGRLIAESNNSFQQQIDELQFYIDKLESLIVETLEQTGGDFQTQTDRFLQVIQYRKQIDGLRKQQDAIRQQASAAAQEIESESKIRRRREGDYFLNKEVLWYRLKTLKPGPLWEDCDCTDEGGGPLLEAELRGNPSLPNP